jgi:hypothetical protein
MYTEKITNDLFGNPVYVESAIMTQAGLMTLEFRYEYDEFGNETGAWSRMKGDEDWEAMR